MTPEERASQRRHEVILACVAGLVVIVLVIGIVLMVLVQRANLHDERVACIDKGGQVTGQTYSSKERCSIPG